MVFFEFNHWQKLLKLQIEKKSDFAEPEWVYECCRTDVKIFGCVISDY